MSQYQGSANKVRCTDCTNLSSGRCSVKDSKVAPRKRRVCSSYTFKGEFTNREPLEAVYFPPVDKKTAKMIKRLMKMGILPVPGPSDASVSPNGQSQVFEMPRSTATASVVGMKSNEDALMSNPNSLSDPNAAPSSEGGDDENQ